MIKVMEGKMEDMKVSMLPYCPVRVGRMYGKAVICCGYREIEDLYECVRCKVPGNIDT